jgi:peptidyl-prolyl cis-trans isomerase SurA
MKKLLTVLCVVIAFSAPAQTLFTYGKESVSADDFLKAFKKNNNSAKDEKALKEYLDLYIASRLKIKEAKEKHLDTSSQLVTDLANLRQQILPNYLPDKESLDKLVNEAFTRSQKDIHIAHIFIAFTKNGNTDVVAADKKRNEVLSKLSKGAKFEELAKEYSDDPAAQNNGGDIGWAAVFTLPYELENVIYTTPAGKISTAYTSKAGHHIFKNLGERKALGRMKAAQVLLALPPGADAATRARLKKTADSLYSRLQAGDDFDKLATAYSNDVVSAASNGQMTEFGVGEFEPLFESTAFSLQKDGAVTKPFLTAHGYHIVKRLKLMPVAVKPDEETMDVVRRKVQGSDRILTTKNILAQKVLKEPGYKKLLFLDSELWAYSDSVLNNQQPESRLTINPATSVLKMGDRTVTVQDWIAFAQNNRYKQDASGVKAYPQLWNDFIQAIALQYYEDHLEDYNEDFRRQVTEFAEGNLFFEIMQQQVWTPAQTDTVALTEYYQKNKNKYYWKESADAVLFYAADATSANEFYKAVQKAPANWKTIAGNYSEQITADSNRFELAQIPKAEKDRLAPGVVTARAVNKADNTVSFAYIIRLHKKEEPRSFADAKGLVINDYQAELEKQWITELKKKYPVTIDEKVWKEMVKKAGKK